MKKYSVFGVLILLFTACDYFKQEDPRTPIARVNNSYLYQEDIQDLVSVSSTREDSTLLITNYVNRWATQQLLIDQAKINLSEAQLQSYMRLVDQYKNDLFTEAYKSNIVSQQLDSVISEEEKKQYYEENKENFRLNDELVQLRYVELALGYENIRDVKERIKRFDSLDRKTLEAMSIQFKSYHFNDTVWVKKESLFKSLPILKHEESEVLKKSNFTQLEDSLGVYLVNIKNRLKRNDIAPLSFVTPTLEQIILNKRKLELIKNLEKDITKDAITNKKFETYTPQ